MASKIAIFTSDVALTQLCARDPGLFCQGPRCMAWRWFETNVEDGNGDLRPNGQTYGYCGLAGSPDPRSDIVR